MLATYEMNKPSLNYNIGSIASYSKYNIPPKALPLLMSTKNSALKDVYLSLDTPPHALFSIQTRGSALSIIYNTIAYPYWASFSRRIWILRSHPLTIPITATI